MRGQTQLPHPAFRLQNMRLGCDMAGAHHGKHVEEIGKGVCSKAG